MGEQTGIEWTDHTFNPWWGCTRVSPACDHCYADATAARFGFDVWGDDAPRRILSDANWAKPLKWDRDAEEAGRAALVFCASMADVFEDRRDLEEHRARLWDLIDDTPHLIWQLLTKRPEHVLDQVPREWWDDDAAAIAFGDPAVWPDNVWIGTTVENQRQADRRIPHLVEIPAPVRFLSCEPLLGPLHLSIPLRILPVEGHGWVHHPEMFGTPDVHWVIAGGESGPGARPSHPDWFRRLRDQVTAAGVPFFFKQWGDWVPYETDGQPGFWQSQHGHFVTTNHFPNDIADPEFQSNVWSADLETAPAEPVVHNRVGKANAGAHLDRTLWREFPPEAQR